MKAKRESIAKVSRLPEGITLENCTVILPRRHSIILIRTPGGAIYSTRETDLAQLHHSNDVERRAFSKLSGVPMSDIRKAMQDRKEKDRAESQRSDLERARRTAARQGYKLTKIRAPKQT